MPCTATTNARSYQRGLATSIKVMRCIRSFSASSSRALIHPPLCSILLNDLKCSNIPPTIPGTAATVSNIMARHP
eukprot:c17873_g1_i1 orf=17-241(+)